MFFNCNFFAWANGKRIFLHVPQLGDILSLSIRLSVGPSVFEMVIHLSHWAGHHYRGKPPGWIFLSVLIILLQFSLVDIILIPQRRRCFCLSALFHFMLLFKFWLGFPRNPSHLLCGGWLVGGAYFGLFSIRRIISHKVWRIFYIEQKVRPVAMDLPTTSLDDC